MQLNLFGQPEPDLSVSVPSLIRWTGSKRSQAVVIAHHVPEHRRYYEPFLGGGALLYLMAGDGSVAGDVYEPLVEFWRAVQRDPQEVVDHYEQQWRLLQQDGPDHFYVVRDRFNRNGGCLDLAFLTRTCVNGIVRFNQAGEFNNSFHLSRKGMNPVRFAQNVARWSRVVRGVEFVCGDYVDTVEGAGAGDFVYLDPPYANSTNRYIRDLDVGGLFRLLGVLNGRGVKWALSFDGQRGGSDFSYPVPDELWERRLLLSSGNSKIGQVLGGKTEEVLESLYLNF